jgi:AraC-like DNA-binding protein
MRKHETASRGEQRVGMAPLEYLTQWRMAVACNTFRSDDANLAVIAERIGYDSETSFSAGSRRMFGQSPGRYRMLHQA